MIHLSLLLISGGLIMWTFHTNARRKRSAAMKSSLTQSNHIDTPEDELKKPPKDGQPDYSEISRLFRIGDMQFARGSFEEAEQHFIRVLAQDPQHTKALDKLGLIYIQQNQPRKAEMIYRKLFSISQKEPTYYCNYGRCLYNQKRLTEAVEAYENAIKLDGSKPSRYISAGQIYYELKDYMKAFGCFQKAVDLDPDNLEYLGLAAELAETVGDTEELRSLLKKMTTLDPYNETAKQKLKQLAPAKKTISKIKKVIQKD